MKIVIDIDERDYEFIKSVRSIKKNSDTFQRIATDLFRAVQESREVKEKNEIDSSIESRNVIGGEPMYKLIECPNKTCIHYKNCCRVKNYNNGHGCNMFEDVKPKQYTHIGIG